MMLRWLITSYAHQAARQHIQTAVVQTLQRISGERTGPPPEDLPPCDVAFLLGTEVEAEGLAKRLEDKVTTRGANLVEHMGRWCDRQVIVAECGVGAAAAERATADLIAMHSPAWVVSAGFAAALGDDLKRGHILMADRVVDMQHDEVAIGLQMDRQTVEATPGLHVGRLLTVDRVLHKSEQKRALGREYDALACDMETRASAEACSRAQVRFLSVRVISDGIDDRWPPEIQALSDQKSWAGKLGAVTGAMFNRPSWVKDWFRLQEEAEKASSHLAKFCAGVVPQLFPTT
jgi:adenosylhomocysteine nucleosidase